MKDYVPIIIVVIISVIFFSICCTLIARDNKSKNIIQLNSHGNELSIDIENDYNFYNYEKQISDNSIKVIINYKEENNENN